MLFFLFSLIIKDCVTIVLFLAQDPNIRDARLTDVTYNAQVMGSADTATGNNRLLIVLFLACLLEYEE